MNSFQTNPRFLMNHLQANILMTQIRAQKKIYNSTKTQQFNISSYHTIATGKKTFKQILYRPSLSPVQTSTSPIELRSRGCLYKQNKNCVTGRRDLQSISPLKQHNTNEGCFGCASGKRRLDHSPSHQLNKTTIGEILRWK